MTTPQPPGGPGPAGAPQYVYGVTRAGTALPDQMRGLDDLPVGLVEDGGVCAAIVSDLPRERALGERADLVAHQRVLNGLVDAGIVVLPFRFGAALAGRAAVEKELLAGNSERFGEQEAAEREEELIRRLNEGRAREQARREQAGG